MAKGYRLDDDGATIELGHDGSPNLEALRADIDLWEFFDKGELLTLRCAHTRAVIATVHRHPADGAEWYRWSPSGGHGRHGFARQTPVADWQRDDGGVPVICPVHGWQIVDAKWVAAEATSTRRAAVVQCT